MKTYKYYDFIVAAFVCVLLCSNLIGAAKAAEVTLPVLGTVTFGAGVLFFPISYIFGDILTEVYGYGKDRRAVWAGFAALTFASLMSWVVLSLPPASRVNTLHMTRAMRGRVSDELEAYAKLLHNHGALSDRVESRKAFAEKRKPNWKGWDNPGDRERTPKFKPAGK